MAEGPSMKWLLVYHILLLHHSNQAYMQILLSQMIFSQIHTQFPYSPTSEPLNSICFRIVFLLSPWNVLRIPHLFSVFMSLHCSKPLSFPSWVLAVVSNHLLRTNCSVLSHSIFLHAFLPCTCLISTMLT